MMINKISIFIGVLLFSVSVLSAQENTEISLGKSFKIHSKIVNEERTCLISLPDSYYDEANIEKHYPVVILLDGYTYFKTAAATIHFMSSARNRYYDMPEAILIAIENNDREHDFTVTKIKTKRANTMGGGRDFLRFIEQELFPYIDEHYRTETFRTLVGHSLGGLLALNSYMDKNSIFDAFLVIDPSIWWDAEMMQAKIDTISPIVLNKKLYIATANQGERNYERNKKRHDMLFALLKKKSDGKLNVEIEYFEEEDHRSVPLIALYKGFKYIYNNDKE
ncbi:MAG: alpha/beta hydrolase [Bacteroidales bacterium]|nr:alpha/beta hydrolase [Bacteroidales bacterium]